VKTLKGGVSVIVDLHSHYPMHLLTGEPDTVRLMLDLRRSSLGDKVRAAVLRLANWIANYEGKDRKPAVTTPIEPPVSLDSRLQ
jgi:hypothetical protein